MIAANVAPQVKKTPRDVSFFMQMYRKVFSDNPELSKRVRVLTLIASLWAAASLVLVGASFTVPLAVMPAFVIGHVVAFRATKKRVPGLPVIIALIIIVVGVAMRHELVLAVHGERVPVAHFLLIAGAASVFEARTRAGLFTQLFFSALVMFFASELAFGNEFAALLGGYIAVIIAFLAMAQYTDLTRDAITPRQGGPLGATGFWVGVTALVAVSSFAAFMLLPWDNSQTPDAARLAIMPLNGSEPGQEAPPSPEELRQMLETAAAAQAAGGGTGATAGGDFGDLDGVGVGGSQASQSGDGAGPVTGDALRAPELEEGSVAYVRSGVSSYWRGAVYDTYDPNALDGAGQWLSTLPDGRRLASLFARPADVEDDDRYLQTFFMQQGLGEEFLSGYEPLSIAIPRDRFGRPLALDGSTYQVVSGMPAISPDDLREDTGDWSSRQYGVLPAEYGEIYRMARALTVDAETDFDKAAAIAAYLNSLPYDPESKSPLESSADLLEFVNGERPGSAIDFATAQALMSRSVGLQSRVATGFLPGTYNPYSGASEIKSTDLHAWAEVLFEDAGWVPVDPSSRPDIPSPTDLESAPPSGLSSLLERRLGDNFASAVGQSPGGLKIAFEWILKSGRFIGGAVMLVALIGGFLSWWFLFRNRKRAASVGGPMSYSRIDGAERSLTLKEFAHIEKRLAKAGFRKRRENEPFAVYATRAGRYLIEGAEDLRVAADLAALAAYSERPMPDGAASEMRSLARTSKMRLATEENS